MLPVNELLQEGRYSISRQIGQNDVGAIYEGFDNIFEKKVFINHCGYNGRTNLAGEEKVLKGIKHELFLRVSDYFAEPSGWFVVMEAEDGEFLSARLSANEASSSSLPAFSDVMRWTEDLLDGLSYLHLNLPPIIYGDLKPQNVILTTAGRIKLLTSAILKTRNASKNYARPSTIALNYSPLEQIWDGLDSASQKVIASSYDEQAERLLRKPVDARSDIYSLGVLIYQTLTGHLPKNALERSIEILEGSSDPLIPPDKHNPLIQSEISEILLKALEIRRENRFDSAVIMRQVLRTAFVRIKEREENSGGASREAEIRETEVKETPKTFATQESFSFDDLTDAEKTTSPVETPRKEVEMPRKEPETVKQPETVSLAAAADENAVQNAEPAGAKDFDIVSLDLPSTESKPAPVKAEKAGEVSPAVPETVEAAEALSLGPSNNLKREERPAQDAPQKEPAVKPAKNIVEFFDFDETDEAEVLGLKNVPETPKKPAAETKAPAAPEIVQRNEPAETPALESPAAQETPAKAEEKAAQVETLRARVEDEKAKAEEEVLNIETPAPAAAEPAPAVEGPVRIAPELPETDYTKDYSTSEYGVLFEEAEKKSGSKWGIPVAALVLVLVVSVAGGAWMFASKSGANTAEPAASIQPDDEPAPTEPAADQPASTAPPSAYDAPATSSDAETAANPADQPAAANVDNVEPNPVITQETVPTAKRPVAARPKPSPSKPQTASAGTPEKEKKKVTVDDLINDY